MDNWPFWMFEENIKLVNEIIEDEEKQRKDQEGGQNANLPDTGSIMRNMTSNMPKF